MKKLVLCSAVAIALAAPAVAFAEEAAAPTTAAAAPAEAPKRGFALHDSAGKRIGRIESVRSDAVSVIYSGKLYYVPLNTITVADRKATTSLSIADIKKL